MTVQATGSGFPGSPTTTGATAVVADVTAIKPTSTTYLEAYAYGTTRPSTSSVNAATGMVVDKEVVIPLSTSGQFVLYNAVGSVNVTVDVEGFLVGSTDSLYVPVTSQRVCDTRSGNPSNLSSPYNQCNGTGNSGETIGSGDTLSVKVDGMAGVPVTASAVIVNVTSLNETTSGNLLVYAAGVSRPDTTTIDFTSGADDTNEATVAVGSSGDIDIYNSAGSTNVLIDVLGYYTTTYAYNGAGLRVSKTVNGTVSQFTYDTTMATPAILEDGTYAFIYGPNGQPFEQVSTSGTVNYFVTDQLGSTRALTNSSGAVVATYSYGPQGIVASETGTASSPIGFAGAYTDAETGFLYLIHRYYDPVTGQFLSVDPLVNQTKQPYIYADDDPINLNDPGGEKFGFIIKVVQDGSDVHFKLSLEDLFFTAFTYVIWWKVAYYQNQSSQKTVTVTNKGAFNPPTSSPDLDSPDLNLPNNSIVSDAAWVSVGGFAKPASLCSAGGVGGDVLFWANKWLGYFPVSFGGWAVEKCVAF